MRVYINGIEATQEDLDTLANNGHKYASGIWVKRTNDIVYITTY